MAAEEVFYLKHMAQKKPTNIRNRNANSFLRYTYPKFCLRWLIPHQKYEKNYKDLPQISRKLSDKRGTHLFLK